MIAKLQQSGRLKPIKTKECLLCGDKLKRGDGRLCGMCRPSNK